jgi:hypothetical protein
LSWNERYYLSEERIWTRRIRRSVDLLVKLLLGLSSTVNLGFGSRGTLSLDSVCSATALEDEDDARGQLRMFHIEVHSHLC